MRPLIVALVLFALLPLAGAQDKRKADKPKGASAGDRNTTSPPAIAINENNCRPPDKSAGNGTQAYPKPEPRPFMTGGEATLSLITFAYVLVSLLAYFTLRDQVNVMKRQINMQESALRQWLNIPNWGVEYKGNRGIVVQCEVVNPTQAPLWLDTISLTVGGSESVEAAGTWLIPQKSYIVESPFSLSVENDIRMQEGKLIFDVTYSLLFRDRRIVGAKRLG